MSLPSGFDLARMQLSDLDQVIAIENTVYPHPWSQQNFADSLHQDHDAWVVRKQSVDGSAQEMLGYFVQMAVVDEMHILNVAVTPSAQGQGIGLYLLSQMAIHANLLEMESLLLEVRASNQRAIQVYDTFGFAYIGRRKGYYPSTQSQREDALVMRLMLRDLISSVNHPIT